MKIPELPAGFTPELLEEVLHNDGALPAGSSVASVEQAQLGDGTGMMAEIAQLTLSYEGDPGMAPRNLIAKFASQNETNRAVGDSYNLPERETRFMAELDSKTSICTPRTYFSGMDEDRFLIVMEDLTDYAVGDQAVGADLRQTEIAIDELAKLHSAFWGRVDELDWVPSIEGSYHAENLAALANPGFDGVVRIFGDYLSESFPEIKGRILAAIPHMQAFMNVPPVTLVHGDFRMANLLYASQPDHHPVVVLDWQGPLLARGINDVAMFLGQSTQTEVRRRYERELIDRYIEGLRAGGVEDLDADSMWQDYRRTVLYNWLYVFAVAGTLDVHNEAAFAWMSKMVKRQTAASEDLNVYEFLPE